MGVDGVFVAFVLIPHTCSSNASREKTSPGWRAKIEQFKFTRSEIDVLTVKTHGARQRIDSQTVRLNNAVRLRGPSPAVGGTAP